MKILGLIIVLAILWLILWSMWKLAKRGYNTWHKSSESKLPWELKERENPEGTHYRYVAVRFGHQDRILSPWLDSATYSDDAFTWKSQCEQVVSDMNYKGLPR